MRGILTGNNVRTNEEYRKVIKSRMRIMVILVIMGIMSATLGFGAEFYFETSINSQMLGVYSGMGVGLIAAGTILWIKQRLLLNNEDKLKENRIKDTDERIKEIGNKAFRIASYAMLIALYAFGLVGGLFNPIIFQVLMVIPCLFLVVYIISFKYYDRKM